LSRSFCSAVTTVVTREFPPGEVTVTALIRRNRSTAFCADTDRRDFLIHRSICSASATMNPNSSSRIVYRFPSESIPRSPTKITRDRWNRLFKSRTTSATVVLSSVLPGKT